MTEQDIRWLQRLDNYGKAFAQLDEAIRTMAERELNRLEQQGVIQSFEYTYELGCNLLKDYLRWQGQAGALAGSRDAIREAFAAGLLNDGEGWMAMLQDRNRTSHTYNEAIAREILANIRQHYHGLLQALHSRMEQLAAQARNA